MLESKKIIAYLKANKNPKGVYNEYKTETASKLASYFPPYTCNYEDKIFVKGELSVVFEGDD